MMMCSRCKKRPAVVFISSMQGTERRNEGLCLRCAKEMGLPQVDEYLKQMGISEEDFENAYDSMFDENGNPDPELLKNIGFEDITNGFKPHDSDTDDDDSEDDVDDSDDPDKKDELFQKGAAFRKVKADRVGSRACDYYVLVLDTLGFVGRVA